MHALSASFLGSFSELWWISSCFALCLYTQVCRRVLHVHYLGTAQLLTRDALRQWWPEILAILMRQLWFQRRFMGFLSQLRVRYLHSELTTECAPGAPTAGYRAPDVTLQPSAASPTALDPKPARLFQLLRGTHHTLLAFCEAGDALAREAVALQARYGALLRVVRVGRSAATASPDPKPDPAADYAPMSDAKALVAMPNNSAHARAAVLHCVDADGSVHKRYGVAAPFAFLIRPDMYIGVARAPAGSLTKEVERRFA